MESGQATRREEKKEGKKKGKGRSCGVFLGRLSLAGKEGKNFSRREHRGRKRKRRE